MRKHGSVVFVLFSVFFVSIQIFMAVRPALPGDLRANFPWGMFKDAGRDNRSIVAFGLKEDGERYDIDLERWFTYTRGATNLRIYDHHPALQQNKSWHKTEQRAFARWLAYKTYQEDGVKLREVHVQRRRVRIKGGKERMQDIRTVVMTPIDYEAAIPREARVNAP